MIWVITLLNTCESLFKKKSVYWSSMKHSKKRISLDISEWGNWAELQFYWSLMKSAQEKSLLRIFFSVWQPVSHRVRDDEIHLENFKWHLNITQRRNAI